MCIRDRDRLTLAKNYFNEFGDSLSVAVCNYKIGSIKSMLDKSDEALLFLYSADSLFQAINSQKGIIDAQYAISQELIKLERSDEALEILEELLPQMKEIQHSEFITATLDYVDILILDGKFKKAEEVLNEQLIHYEKSKDWEQLQMIVSRLAIVNEKQEFYDKALSFRKREKIYSDSFVTYGYKIKEEKSQNAFLALRQKLEAEQLKLQEKIDLQEAELKQYKRNTFIAFLILALAGIFLITYILKQKRKTLAEKNEDLNKSKERLFTSFTTEFNPPVEHIKSLLTKIQNKELPDSIMSLINEANQTTNKLSGLLGLIINWNRLESNLGFVDPQEGDLAKQIKSSFDAVKKAHQEKEIMWILDIIPEKMICKFDFEKLDLLIKSILDHMAALTPEQGIISLYSRLEGEDMVRLVIKDNGKGVPEDKLDQLFDWKYNVDAKGNRESEGYHMAFAMCKDLVNSLDGKIEYIINSSNTGMHFSCLLPYTIIENQSLFPTKSFSKSQAPIPSVLQKSEENLPNILLIMDHVELSEHLSFQLSDTYEVSVSNSDEIGKAIAFKEIPDLILFDLPFDKFQKTNILGEIKNSLLTDHIPLVVFDKQVEFKNTAQSEYVSFAKLPMNEDANELISTLENILENNSQVDFKLERTAGCSLFNALLLDVFEMNLENEKISVEEIAHKIKMSNGQLLKKSKALYNTNPRTLLSNYRLFKAHQMIENGKYSSYTEVSQKCGFKNEKEFKKLYDKRYNS